MIQYQLSAVDLPGPGYAVEHRGGVTFTLNRGLFLPEEIVTLNTLATATFEQGTMYQLWQGELVRIGGPVEAPVLHRVPSPH